jgi:hypothetical protein
MFVNSRQFKSARETKWSNSCVVDFDDFDLIDLKNGGRKAEFKTTMSTSAGFAPFVERTGDVVPYAFRRITVPQLMPSITTTQDSIKYMEETSPPSSHRYLATWLILSGQRRYKTMSPPSPTRWATICSSSTSK